LMADDDDDDEAIPGGGSDGATGPLGAPDVDAM
jgi:hypothetical protein